MKYQRETSVLFFCGFLFGFSGLSATFNAESDTVFTFCKHRKRVFYPLHWIRVANL